MQRGQILEALPPLHLCCFCMQSDLQSWGGAETSCSGFRQAPEFLRKNLIHECFSLCSTTEMQLAEARRHCWTPCRHTTERFPVWREELLFPIKPSRGIEAAILAGARKKSALFAGRVPWRVFRWHQEVSTVFHLSQKMALLTLQPRSAPAAAPAREGAPAQPGRPGLQRLRLPGVLALEHPPNAALLGSRGLIPQPTVLWRQAFLQHHPYLVVVAQGERVARKLTRVRRYLVPLKSNS